MLARSTTLSSSSAAAFMTLALSWVYKRSALALLILLFLAFISFGTMMVFFLISSSWGAPIILSRGNELVDRAERNLGEMLVRRNDVLAETARLDVEWQKAQLDFARAAALVGSLKETIRAEIVARRNLLASYRASMQDLSGSETEFSSLVTGDAGATAQQAFDQRIIARRQAMADRMTAADARFRLMTIRSELRLLQERITATVQALAVLQDLHKRLSDPVAGVGATLGGGGAEMIVFVDRTITALTDFVVSQTAFIAVEKRRDIAAASNAVLDTGIVHLKTTPLGRAVEYPVNVVFVPYPNADNFTVNTRLYSCRLWIVICRRVGFVRALVDGEAAIPHPVFNRPMRGRFVDVHLTDPDAAKELIILVGFVPLLL